MGATAALYLSLAGLNIDDGRNKRAIMQSVDRFRRFLSTQLTRHQPLILVLFLVLLFRFMHVFFGSVWFFGDDFSLMVPSKLFTIFWLKQGVLPLWNPTALGGFSWIGDISQWPGYISTIFFWIFSPAVAVSVNQVVHTAIGFLGTYWLGRTWGLRQRASLLAAVVWSCSTSVVGTNSNLAIMQSLSWVPWIAAAVIRQLNQTTPTAVVRVALFTSLLLYGGYPQVLGFAVLAGVLLGMWKVMLTSRPSLVRLLAKIMGGVLAGALSFVLSAVVLLPFIESLMLSTRGLQTSQQAAAGSVHPLELIKTLIPPFFNSFREGMRWGPAQVMEPNLVWYIGWFLLLLLFLKVWKKRTREDVFLGLCVLATTLLALGSNLPFFSRILELLPILRFLRGPGMIYVVTTLLLGVWVGSVWEKGVFLSKMVTRRFEVCVFLLILVFAGGLFFLPNYFSVVWQSADHLLAGKLSTSAFHTVPRDMIIVRIILSSLVVNAIGFWMSLRLWHSRHRNRILYIVVLELSMLSTHLYMLAPSRVYEQRVDEKLLAAVQNPQYRVLMRNASQPYTDFGTYYGALAIRQPFSDSYVDAKELTEFAGAQRMRDYLTPDWNMPLQVRSLQTYTTLLPADVDAYWGKPERVSINALPFVASTDPRLREWAVGRYVVDDWFPQYGETYPSTLLASGDRSQREYWQVYELPSLTRFRYWSDRPVQLQNFQETPNIISFTTTVPQNETRLLVADRWDPYWRASVNGVLVDVQKTEHNLRAIAVPTGTIQVKMWYQPTTFWVGLLISMASWLGLALAYGAKYVRTRVPKSQIRQRD